VLDASGYVTARRQATVSAKITGKVTEVLIEEGQRVREGAVLARLDDTEARGPARAHAGPARRRALPARRGPRQLVQAEQDYTRQKELADRKLIRPAGARCGARQRDMLRARLAATEEQVKVATESQAVAQVQLDNTVIPRPVRWGGHRQVGPAGRDDLADLGGRRLHPHRHRHHRDMDSLEIQVDVNESYINRVTPGQPVEATLNAYPDWKIPGDVIAIIPTADRSKANRSRCASRSRRRTRASCPTWARGWLPRRQAGGRRAAARAQRAGARGLRAHEGDAAVVFVYASGKVERRSVTLGPDVSGQRRVLSGLRDGETRRARAAARPSADGQAVKTAEPR